MKPAAGSTDGLPNLDCLACGVHIATRFVFRFLAPNIAAYCCSGGGLRASAVSCCVSAAAGSNLGGTALWVYCLQLGQFRRLFHLVSTTTFPATEATTTAANIMGMTKVLMVIAMMMTMTNSRLMTNSRVIL